MSARNNSKREKRTPVRHIDVGVTHALKKIVPKYYLVIYIICIFYENNENNNNKLNTVTP